MYHGDIRLGDTIDIKFVTTAVATGAPTQLAGSPVISAYVGNGTTELTAGITLSVDFDSRTGLNNVRVVATSGNGYATATNVQLVMTTGTVGGTSVVGYVVGTFSIEARSAVMPTTAARTLDITATGAAGIDWGNVENPTTTVSFTGTTINLVTTTTTATTATNVTTVNGIAANAITAASMAADASAEIADAVWDEDATGHQTQGTFGQAIGDPVADTNTIYKAVVTDAAGATVGVDVVAVKAETASIQSDTNDLQTQVGTAGAGLTNINLPNQTMDIIGNITGNLSGSVGSVTAGVTVTTNNDKTGYGLSAAAVQAIWDALTSALTTVGSIGKKLADWTIGTAQTGDSFARLGAPAGASISADIAAVKVDTAAIKTKTDLIPAVPASTGDAMTLTAGERTTLAGVVGTTAQTESYRADGATGSIAQLLYEATAHLGESSIAGTTKTIKKIDGTTTAATFTLDDATTPTSITRAT